MRKFLILIINIFIIILFSYESALAKNVDESTIHQIAQNFLNTKSTIHTRALNKQVVYNVHKIEQINHLTDNSLLAHIVRIQPKGFLIISPLLGNDPVIAYTFNHNWNHKIDENDFIYTLLRLDLDLRKENLKKFSNDNMDLNRDDWDSEFKLADINTLDIYKWPDGSDTGGWITTTWRQSAPYNSMCPMDTTVDKRSSVGCLALALAQIVNYHQYFGDFELDKKYNSRSKNQDVHIDTDSSEFAFPSFTKLNSYLKQIGTKFKDKNLELNDSEIAALCFACGILLEMNYSPDSSTPSSFAQYNLARFIRNKLTYLTANFENFYKGSEFSNILINNMINALPVILEIKSSLTGAGHAVILDGYRTDGYFHLNFGWGDAEPEPIWTVWWNGIPDSLPDPYNRVIDAIVNINPEHMDKLSLNTNNNILHFNPSPIGHGSSREIQIENTCGLYLYIYWIQISKNFHFEPTHYPYVPGTLISLVPGNKLDVNIKCKPTVADTVYGKLQVFAKSVKDQHTYLEIDLVGEGLPGTLIDGGAVSGRWKNDASSPYYIHGDINIEEGKSLIIEPGTQIIFKDSYAFTISQNAQLIAKGAESDSIYLKTENNNKTWQGILFKDSGYDDTLAYCVLRDAKRTVTNNVNRGGVISIDNSSPTITHSRIMRNKNYSNGGGMFLYNSNAPISHLRFEENVAPQNGGALYMVNSSPTISNTIFCNNQASSGGAIYAYKSSPTLTNVTIANNKAIDHGGAIYAYKSSPTLTNVTIADNKAADNGGAIALGQNCYIEVENSIIWANEAEGEGSTLAFLSSSVPGSIIFNYSNLDTLSSQWINPNGQEHIQWLNGILCTDPIFTNQQDFIYTLQEGSPCIDAGNPDPEYNDPEDLPDNPGYARPPAMGTVRNDMGALGGPDVITKIERKFALPPSSYMLYQNYPNPFNPTTIINYDVGANSNSPVHVDLSIYNILGQKVVTLVSGRQNAGFHSVEWDAAGFTSGIYLYKLQTNNGFSVTKKLVFLR